MREREITEAAFGITQGVKMGRQSKISIEVMAHGDNVGIKNVFLSGKAVLVMNGTE
jgi:predicted PhzF superfamily epimerase YddE/YHI9